MFKEIKTFLNNVNEITSFTEIHQNKKVFFFSVNYDWIRFCVASGAILSKRGCVVSVVYDKRWDFNNVPKDIVEKSYKENFQGIKKDYFDDNLFLIELERCQEIQNIDQYIIDEIEKQILIDICHNYHVINADINGKYKNVYLDYKNYYIELAKKLLIFLKKNQYDSYILPVGTNYGWAICRIIFEFLDIKYTSIEGSISFNDRKIVTSKNYPAVMFNRKSLSPEWEEFKKKVDIKDFKEIKKLNLIDLKKIYNPKNKTSLQSSTHKKLSFEDRNKILILPSFVHEMHHRLEHYCFKDQNDWLFSTLDFFQKNQDLLKKFEVIIRFHPLPVYAEGKNIDLENFAASEEYSYNIFNKNRDYDNLFTIITPTQLENSNTLDLINSSDLIITYQSAAGLEASLLNKKVINLTSSFWSGNGFSFEPKSRLEYFQLMNSYFENSLEKLNNQNAHLFFYFFHNIYHKDFIWNMMWGGNFLNENQIDEVICLPNLISNYFNNFDYLLGIKPKKIKNEFKILINEINKKIKNKDFCVAEKIVGIKKLKYLKNKDILRNLIKIFQIYYLNFKLYLCKSFYN